MSDELIAEIFKMADEWKQQNVWYEQMLEIARILKLLSPEPKWVIITETTTNSEWAQNDQRTD